MYENARCMKLLAACVLQHIVLRVLSCVRGKQGTTEKGQKQSHGMNVIEKNRKMQYKKQKRNGGNCKKFLG